MRRGVIRGYTGETIPWPCLAAAALAPAVRYEDVVYTGALCAVLLCRRRAGAAVAIAVASLLPLIGLGLFLRAHGLSFFPNSILAKSGAGGGMGPPGTPGLHLVRLASGNLLDVFRKFRRWPIVLCLGIVAVYTWRLRDRVRPFPMVLVLLASVAMVLVGPYEWFYRYDVALRFFLVLLALWMLLEAAGRETRALVASVAVTSAAALSLGSLKTPMASLEISRQQYEMHRLANLVGDEAVAVNDIGWVGLGAEHKFYVLDLVGLSNVETLRALHKDAAWQDRVTRKHGVGLVMMYPEWFGAAPANWKLLGVLRQSHLRLKGSTFEDTVALYATSQEKAAKLAPAVEAFRKTLPSGVWITPN